jgi:hypothetical protein
MKINRSLAKRASAAALIVATGCVLAGCIFGRQQASDLTTNLGATSKRAEDVSTNLKAAAGAERQCLTVALTQLLDAKQAEATAQIDRLLADFSQNAAAKQRAALTSLLAQRSTLVSAANESITKTMAPLRKDVDEAQEAMKTARAIADAHPLDHDLRHAHDEAEAKYLVLYASYNQIVGTAELRLHDAFGMALEQFAKDSDATVTNQVGAAQQLGQSAKQAIDKARRDATDKIAALMPATNADAYDALVKYSQAVGSAGEAYKNYLAANSWGAGSFLDEFTKTFVRDLVPNTLGVLKGDKPVTSADWTNSLNGIAKAAYGDLSSSFQNDMSKLKESTAQQIDAAKADVTKSLTAAAQKLITDKLGELLPTKPDEKKNAGTPVAANP